jgi:hypothetical protein
MFSPMNGKSFNNVNLRTLLSMNLKIQCKKQSETFYFKFLFAEIQNNHAERASNTKEKSFYLWMSAAVDFCAANVWGVRLLSNANLIEMPKLGIAIIIDAMKKILSKDNFFFPPSALLTWFDFHFSVQLCRFRGRSSNLISYEYYDKLELVSFWDE